MMKRLIILILTLLVFKSQAQKCNCNALVDVEFKKEILVYDKPNGQIIKRLSHDFKNENYLLLTIDNDTSDFFHVDLSYALTNNSSVKGWIKKSKVIGTYARNYAPKDTLLLFSKPDIKSKIFSKIPDWSNQLYVIEKCFKDWVYVKLNYKGNLKEGWLSADRQCDNPYTTCN